MPKEIIHDILADSPERLDKCIAKHITNLSRGYISALIKTGNIQVNKTKIIKPSHKVKKTDIITIILPPPKKLTLKPQKADLDIVFSNQDYLVINKPPGMTVHPSHGHTENTLVNVLLYHYPEFKNFEPINNIYRPGIVHRLDKNTSGLLIVAKNQSTLKKFQADIKERKWKKYYYALVLNNNQYDRGVINKNIIRNPHDRKKFSPTNTAKGKTAITKYKTLKNYHFNNHHISLLEINIITGRTHQIRVHLASENIFILGDTSYFNKDSKKITKLLRINRQLLHAFKLIISDPKNKKQKYEIKLPDDFVSTINHLSMIKN